MGRIESFHRTLREEEISLHQCSNPEEERERIRAAIKRYSTERYHQGIGDIKPIDSTGMKVGSRKSELEGRNFSAVLRETAGNLKS